MITTSKRLIDWTDEDLSMFLDMYLSKYKDVESIPTETVRGLNEIAKILHCSKRQVSRLKNQGVLDNGISQIGNIIIGYPEKLKNINTK